MTRATAARSDDERTARPDDDGARGRTLERVGFVVAATIVVLHGVVTVDASSLWLDEAYSLGAVNRLGESLTETHGTMGLYYVLLTAWGQISTQTWWLRVPSVLFALATLALLRPIARRIGGPELVLVSLPLLALAPMFLWKATEARGYALETLLVCLAWYVLLRAIDLDRFTPVWHLALVPISIAGVFSHGLFVVFLVPLVAVAFCGPRGWRSVVWLLPACIAASLTVLMLAASGASNIGTHVAGGPDVLIASVLEAFVTRAALPRLVLSQFIAVGLIVSIRHGLRSPALRDRAVALVPAAWTILPCVTLALLSWYHPRFNPRYLAPIDPGIALLLGTAALAVDRRIRGSRGSRPMRTAGAACVLVVVVRAVTMIQSDPFIEHDWRAAASIVAEHAEPGDGIVFANLSTRNPVQHRPPFEAAWRETAHDVVPVAVSPPRPLGEVRRIDHPLSLEALARAAQRHDRIWVVESQESRRDVAEAIAEEPRFHRSFRLRERWVVTGGIVLHLYEQRP